MQFELELFSCGDFRGRFSVFRRGGLVSISWRVSRRDLWLFLSILHLASALGLEGQRFP